MNVKVNEIMTDHVITTDENRSIGHARTLIKQNHVGSIPVVNEDREPVGVVSTSDLLDESDDQALISSIMTKKVYTIPKYEDVSIAARIMRNHKIHHVIVTHEKQLVGIVSSFDLLKLVEDHRFVVKNAPSPTHKKGGHRSEF